MSKPFLCKSWSCNNGGTQIRVCPLCHDENDPLANVTLPETAELLTEISIKEIKLYGRKLYGSDASWNISRGALDVAVHSNRLEIVRDLYDCGAFHIREIIKITIEGNSFDIFKWGYKKIRSDKEIVTEVLEYAIRLDRIQFVKWMFKKGAEIYLTDLYNTRDWPLISVAFTDDVKLAEILREKGATVSNTALAEASGRANINMMAYLLDNGCDANANNSGHLRGLLRASISGWGGYEMREKKVIPGIQMLLSRGATVMKEHIFYAIEVIASRTTGPELLKILLNHGIDADIINSRNDSGMTPLMLACERRQAKCIKILLNAGADTNILTPNGETALMLATKRGYKDCTKLLQRWKECL